MQTVIGGDLVLAFDNDGLLRQVSSTANDQIYTTQRTGTSPWRIELRDRTGLGRMITALNASRCHTERGNDGVLQLTWREIAGAGGLVVRAMFEPQADGLACRLTVEGLHPEAALWHADFPCLEGVQPSRDLRLLLPKAGGFVVRNLDRARLSELDRDVGTFSYPCDLTMQFAAFYREGGDGFLIMTQDQAGHYKRFVLRREQGALTLAVQHFPAGMPLSDGRFLLPYPVVLAVCDGDWADVATRYRAWAIRQPWCDRGPLYARRDIPAWLLTNGLWVWNRGPSREVLPGARRLQEKVQAPVALDWYWWHHTAYDTHFPDYLPPREGEEAFRQAIECLHADGLRAIVYLNGRLWGTHAVSWSARQAETAACRRADGDIYRELYCIFDPAEAEVTPMCPATELWQTTIRNLVAAILDYGLDGVYLDQIGHTEPRMCHAAEHGHPAGGGNHWHDGYRALMRGVRQAAQAYSDVVLPTEGACEAYLDLFDAFLVLDNSYERLGFYNRFDLNWESVPLFAAVYHDYALQFGSYASLAPPPYDALWPKPQGAVRSSHYRERDFADAFYTELGRAFVAGAQPMVSNVYVSDLEDPRLQEHWHFLRELVQVRRHAAAFLTYGVWRRPPRLDVPEVTIDFLVRGIYTRPEQEHVVQRRLPAVLTSFWAAIDGRLGLALANISADAQPIAWRAVDVPAGRPVYLIDDHGRAPSGCVDNGGLVFEGIVPGRSARVIEIGSEHDEN